jgi:sulfur relay protein TusB/DsrH
MSNNDSLQSQACLHMLFSHNGDCFRDCIAQFRAGDILILLNTGVLLLLEPSLMNDLPPETAVYAVDADVQAHGLAELQATTGSLLIDDAAWARLVISHGKILSWK